MNHLHLFEEHNFPSLYKIGDNISFIPMFIHTNKYQISNEKRYGIITAVRFTKSKVFYDIVDDYNGYLFDNVDSSNVSNEI